MKNFFCTLAFLAAFFFWLCGLVFVFLFALTLLRDGIFEVELLFAVIFFAVLGVLCMCFMLWLDGKTSGKPSESKRNETYERSYDGKGYSREEDADRPAGKKGCGCIGWVIVIVIIVLLVLSFCGMIRA